MKSRGAPPGPQAARQDSLPLLICKAARVSVLAGLLAGCGGEAGRHVDPVAWWHNLEGGPIAAQRPPPPGADDPYPNLASVPPKPKPIDPKERAEVFAALAADRADARYEAEQQPLVAAPAPARATNGLFAGPAPLKAADPDAAGAALDAATPPPVTAQAPSRAELAEAAATKPVLDDTPIVEAAVANTPVPTIPDAPPAPPSLSGVSIPVTVPHLPPKAPPPVAPSPAALTARQLAPVPVAFSEGSAILPSTEKGPLASLAGRRGRHGIEIIGFGDTEATDAVAQQDGVRLGLARARAIAVALESAGVPMAALHMAGNAPGRGAAARLIE